MNREEIIEHLLTSSTRLRLDEVTIRMEGDKSCRARGMVWRDDVAETFRMRLTLLDDVKIDMMRTGVFTPEDCWHISGVLEDMIDLHCLDMLSSAPSHFGDRTVHWAEFDVNMLSLRPARDEETEMDRMARSRAVHEKLSQTLPQLFSTPWNEDLFRAKEQQRKWSARITIPGVKAVYLNQSTKVEEANPATGGTSREFMSTLSGEWNGRKFAIIQRENACEVVLSETDDCHSATSDDFEQQVESLLYAVSFTNGWEPWWQRMVVRRGANEVQDDVRAITIAPSSRYSPLRKRTCHFGGDPVRLTGLAWDFFRTDPDAPEITRALHLFRQATQEQIPFDIGLLAQCTVFEGIVGFLYKRIETVEHKASGAAFGAAKHEIVKLLEEKLAGAQEVPHQEAWTRLRNYIHGAHQLRHKDKFRRVCEHYRLSEDTFMKPVLKEWENHRNHLAHGRATQTEPAAGMYASSRIAGAMYILLAKLFGYNGRIISSQLEDKDAYV